ncbi:glycosyltransferase [Colwellia psychrerythraea]|uniref:Glycosyl transferase group 1 n=1 Tax=Colwellia psychrerythraea TaxID=28229 RepID=A0A099KEM5_COLPS|nr:glycosyltransferase [Colwellia psychrerythraea]KGJ88821.1 glycosyl transferase group 1 [Colwellia psychrerythraea]
MSTKKSFYNFSYLHLINDSDVSRGGAQKILNLLTNDDVGTLTLKDSLIKFKLGVLLWQFFLVFFCNLINRPKCVFIHSRCYLPFSCVFRLFGVEVVFYTHAHYRSHRWLFKYFRCNHYIAVSQAVAVSLKKQGVESSLIKVIPNPYFGEEYYEIIHDNLNYNSFASVGSLRAWKGFKEAINLLGLISVKYDNKFVYSIVGEGSERKSLSLAADSHPNIELVLRGFQEHPFETLRDSPFIIIPSLEEGFGLVAIESIFQHKIVIYSDVPALREICGQDPLSFSFNINSHESFEKAVNKAKSFSDSLSDIKVLIQRQAYIKKHFGLAAFYANHNKFLIEVCSSELY